jgi:hypothetical protein
MRRTRPRLLHWLVGSGRRRLRPASRCCGRVRRSSSASIRSVSSPWPGSRAPGRALRLLLPAGGVDPSSTQPPGRAGAWSRWRACAALCGAGGAASGLLTDAYPPGGSPAWGGEPFVKSAVLRRLVMGSVIALVVIRKVVVHRLRAAGRRPTAMTRMASLLPVEVALADGTVAALRLPARVDPPAWRLFPSSAWCWSRAPGGIRRRCRGSPPGRTPPSCCCRGRPVRGSTSHDRYSLPVSPRGACRSWSRLGARGGHARHAAPAPRSAWREGVLLEAQLATWASGGGATRDPELGRGRIRRRDLPQQPGADVRGPGPGGTPSKRSAPLAAERDDATTSAACSDPGTARRPRGDREAPADRVSGAGESGELYQRTLRGSASAPAPRLSPRPMSSPAGQLGQALRRRGEELAQLGRPARRRCSARLSRFSRSRIIHERSTHVGGRLSPHEPARSRNARS